MASHDHDLMRKALEAPTSTEGISAMRQFHSGVFDDVISTQLKGWGADNFLVHGNDTHFTIVAEFRSGNRHDRSYAANALRTWHVLAEDVLRLREADRDAQKLAVLLRDQIGYGACGCTDEQKCRAHVFLTDYYRRQSERARKGYEEKNGDG
jgi:hypothetical protein